MRAISSELKQQLHSFFEFRFHRGQEIKESSRYHITLENDQKLYHMARLDIANVTNSDQGEYKAVARNTYGEGVATINLNFEGTGKPKYCLNLHISLFIDYA